MSYANQLQNKYELPSRNFVREVTWDPDGAEAAVYKKVSDWLSMQTVRPLSPIQEDSPDMIPGSPIVNRSRRSRLNGTWQKSLMKTPSPKTTKPQQTSPIVRSKPLLARKRKLFESAIKIERETDDDQVQKIENVDNSSSPILITKRYRWRKKERSLMIKKEPLSQLDTVPIKIEQSLNDSEKENSPQIRKFDFPYSPLINNDSLVKIDEVESEVGDKKENLIDNISIASEEVKSKSLTIEDLFSQETGEKVETVRIDDAANLSDTSDETYCSKAERKIETVVSQRLTQKAEALSSAKHIESQKISEVSLLSTDKTLTNENVTTRFNFSSTSLGKKKRKLNKNSLLDKLQNLVSIRASFNRLWRHQISQPQFQKCQKQYLVLDVRKTYPLNGRQIFECKILENQNNLSTSPLDDKSSLLNIVAVPEIVGTIVVPDFTYMKLFPPWKVINEDQRLIEAAKFIFELKSRFDLKDTATTKINREKTKKFDCLCLKANKLCENCDEKFRKRKPCIVDELFDS